MAYPQRRRAPCTSVAVLVLAAMPPAALAQLTINENLTGPSSSFDWTASDGACLTAGDGRASSIPACIGLPYYQGKKQVGGKAGRMLEGRRDAPGEGALRLTNGDVGSGSNGNQQKGIVYSNFSFPSNQGVDITFGTVTYGGNAYPNRLKQASGADGISFFLADAAGTGRALGLGAAGGNLAYTCANGEHGDPPVADGLQNGYVGLGIDEFGNFSWQNGRSTPNSISLRGAGNIRWDTLPRNLYPESKYPSAGAKATAVRKVCKDGKLSNGARAANYSVLLSQTLPGSLTLFNQQAVARPSRDQARPVTYNLKITQDGLLSFAYSFNGGATTPLITDRDITRDNGPLPAAFRFGFGASTGGGSNVHEIICFKAEQANSAASSAGGNIPPEGRVQVGSQLYLASYHPRNWWGQLRAHRLVLNADDSASIAPLATWDGSCVLTGGACNATGSNANTAAQASRRLLTWSGSQGVELRHANLSAAQKQSLPADGQRATAFIDYLRGVRGEEVQPGGGGTFRRRDSVLGDIINASPTWVGAPASPYTEKWADRLYPGQTPPEGTSYPLFANAQAGRTHVVYAGANDGFLHGFRAGRTLPGGSFDSARNDGEEVLGYMPAQALQTMAHPAADVRLGYGNTQYSHNAYVDATPGVGDLFVEGAWRTWLAGGLGAGGTVDANGVPQGVIANDVDIGTGALYLLDVTDPDAFAHSGPAQLVKGEWNSRTIVCAGDTAASRCGDSLGSTYGTPLIRRLHHGGWGIIFANGQNSRSGQSGIFILLIDPDTGARSFRFLPAGEPVKAGALITRRNGITQVTAADLDGDHVSDYVYAGDMLGNVWRFDLTSDTASDWAVDRPAVFNAGRPITTAILVSATTRRDVYRVVLNFGTGKLYPQSLDQGAHFAPGPYALYGIWDANMQAWNARSSTAYESLPPNQVATINAAQLQAQTLTRQSFSNATLGISGIRTITRNAVCWKNGTDCASGNDRMGWSITLPDEGEQIVHNPAFVDGMLVVNTTTPAVSRTLSCEVKQATGYTLALRPDTGSVAAKNYFMNTGYTGGIIAGIGTSGTGAALSVETDSRKFIVTQTDDGSGKVFEVDPSVNVNAQRVNWWRVR